MSAYVDTFSFNSLIQWVENQTKDDLISNGRAMAILRELPTKGPCSLIEVLDRLINIMDTCDVNDRVVRRRVARARADELLPEVLRILENAVERMTPTTEYAISGHMLYKKIEEALNADEESEELLNCQDENLSELLDSYENYDDGYENYDFRVDTE